MTLNPSVTAGPPEARPRKGLPLIIERDEVNSRVLSLLLARKGLDSVLANSTGEAIALWKLHGKEIDVVIAEANLEGENDGIELAHLMKRIKPDLKVILGTKRLHAKLCSDGSSGEVNYVNGPFDSSALVAIVSGCYTHYGIPA